MADFSSGQPLPYVAHPVKGGLRATTFVGPAALLETI